ncbi:MAG: glycogen debranching protein GlgX [bacterium]|nr:glycogen debranching protein GlgX [bacterium]
MENLALGVGAPAPLGASITADGVNFSLFSRSAHDVELLLFDRAEQIEPSRIVRLEPHRNRTYHYWHVFVPGIKAGQIYGFRVHGPLDPEQGLRFDGDKVLLDPYGRGLVLPDSYTRTAASRQGDNAATAMKSVVVDMSDYDWEGDKPVRRPSWQTVIYEMHVAGFTRNPNSGLDDHLRGSYAGFIEKIPYLSDLGVNAVELLPVFAFDPQDCPPGLINYWGYAPISFFAPHPAYSSRRDPLGPVNELRDLIKALHRAGIEVILDVVFNHTAEGNQDGPTLCFRGIDNLTYYILEENKSDYANFSGCGNTLNANHPIVRRMILDSLRYWVQEYHIDGFRFDLASILARDAQGRVLPNPPVLWDIESDPALAGVKLIAEAWDASGLYQVGSFVGDAWREWNGKFRDDVRDFIRGEPGTAGKMADRMLGSHQVYAHKRREAEQSINFVTSHDGFTLNDLVSYNEKHNLRNGESNRDGDNHNRSWNCGVEGPTDDPEIERLRIRQIKNFLTLTVMSLGMPMIVMGDEVRRTQLGNNNAYCLDDETVWFDWSLVEEHAEIHRFVQLLLSRRVLRNSVFEEKPLSLNELIQISGVQWHGTRLHQPDWSRSSHSFALCVENYEGSAFVYVAVNAYWEALDFELPTLDSDKQWHRWIDTSLPTPDDICLLDERKPVKNQHYQVGPRSVVLLVASTIVH